MSDDTNILDNEISMAEPRDYFALLKPRVMSLVIFTALVGLMVAPDGINPFIGLVAILCIAVGAGASGALNMWVDFDIDAIMSRTQSRPIPAGKVRRQEVLPFGLILSAASVIVLGIATNWLAGGLLAFTIFFYAVVYSMWLKRSTPQNIVIGGAAGAFPPMIGWAAVTGTITIESIVLFMIIFIWTPPHFWALALFKLGDYEKAGIPMMPNVAGHQSTKLQILLYSIVLAPFGVAPWFLGFAGIFYGVVSLIMGLIFLYFAYLTYKMSDDDEKMLPAKKLFGFSIFYLTVLFAVLLIENLVMTYLPLIMA
jgi:protoheme IX farnesyltransferase